MSWPDRLPADTAVKWPVSTLDLTPTFLAAAGAPPMKGADGMDLLPYLEPVTSKTGPDRALYWRFYTQWGREKAVRRGPWKWIEAARLKGGNALFNIAHDSSERKNLIAEHPDIATSLEKEFTDWNKALADPKWVTLYPEKSGD